jgi:hypothetical protein
VAARRRGSERRRFARVAEHVRVSYAPAAQHGGVELQTLNFSAGGVLFVSPAPLAPGLDLRLTLTLESDGDLSFDARVVRVRTLGDRTHEVAAELRGGSAEAQRSLLAHIERQAGALPDADPPRITA